MKSTLLEINEEAIIVENEFCAIGVIKDDEPMKDSRDVRKKPQATTSKVKKRKQVILKPLPILLIT